MAGERPATAERWLTAKEAAAHLGYAVGTLYNKVAAKAIPFRKLGGQLRFRASELDAWVEERNADAMAAAEQRKAS